MLAPEISSSTHSSGVGSSMTTVSSLHCLCLLIVWRSMVQILPPLYTTKQTDVVGSLLSFFCATARICSHWPTVFVLSFSSVFAEE